MRRLYYSYYAEHGLRFYCKHPDHTGKFRSKSDELNWNTAKNVLLDSDPFSRSILVRIYGSSNRVIDSVKEISKEMDLSQECILNMIDNIQKRFAVKREIL